MYRDHSVAVVVPAYNEEGYVGSVIDAIPGYVDRAYVVDDGSTDDTWAEIRRHAAARNAEVDSAFGDLVVPVRHDENRGVGGAIKTGYRRARAEGIDVTAVLGGDDQMDPAVLPRYLDPIVEDEADYTKGTRFADAADWRAMPRFRFVGNVVLSYLTKIASGYWGSMDSQNGYSAISLRALEAIDLDGLYEYYGYCNDLLVRLNTAEMRVADVPHSAEFTYEDGWKSHIELRAYVPRVSVMLLRGFLRRLTRKYLLHDYHPLAPLYLLGGALSAVSSVGLFGAVLGRTRDGPAAWLLGLAAGLGTLLWATLLDREDNRDLERHLERPERSTGRTEATAREPSVRGDGETPDGEPVDGSPEA
ncbi:MULTISPECIES: glycosyltransferase family 2 protein [Salinibaculum]|uniref:glycosyltransferase family 2 protein n=1 Tax=Salinibaculum TaxID=2732368 RepID=UPI0030D1355A